MNKLIRISVALCFLITLALILPAQQNLLGTAKAKAKAQTNARNFTITCSFDGLPDKSNAYLLTQHRDTLQTVTSNGDKFTFKGSLQDGGKILFITFDPYICQYPMNGIFVYDKEIRVEGEAGKTDIFVTGSPANKEYWDFYKYLQLQVKDKGNDVDGEKDIDELTQSKDVAKAKYVEAEKKWILDHISSPVIPAILVNTIDQIGVDFTKTVFNKLTKSAKASYYGQQLAKAIPYAEVYSRFKAGAMMPNIVIADMKGKPRKIYDVLKGRKLTLLDFWASWCIPCRAEIPNMKRVLDKYDNAGLQIVGISLDKVTDKWLKAIADDKTTWNHYIEIANAPFNKSFSIGSIPAYILLDESGKMLAFDCGASSVKSFGGNLRGEKMDVTIDEALKSINSLH